MKYLSFILLIPFLQACQSNTVPKEQQVTPTQATSTSTLLSSDPATMDSNGSDCNCTNAKRTFKFKNGSEVALCGEQDEENYFSQFILTECINESILEDWTNDGTVSSLVNFKDDTLTVEERYAIPNGKNREVQWLPFLVKQYYYVDNDLKSTRYYSRNLKKYTQQEIDEVLKDFKKLSDKNDNMDEYLKNVNQLFWAYYSGSAEAGKVLEGLKSKSASFDGAVSEEFNTYIATYKHYKLLKGYR